MCLREAGILTCFFSTAPEDDHYSTEAGGWGGGGTPFPRPWAWGSSSPAGKSRATGWYISFFWPKNHHQKPRKPSKSLDDLTSRSHMHIQNIDNSFLGSVSESKLFQIQQFIWFDRRDFSRGSGTLPYQGDKGQNWPPQPWYKFGCEAYISCHVNWC